ncbi:PAS domain-containing sensor histidine kinase [Pelagibacterium luteolum]|uniref:histidine kinase n=1 Tax=Pelagibacterium luteolum TaxID=440168 RepID=A0A1G7TP76_9HYPH|nr:PAS domain-containing sensor histidine kinase [Pelagibacterium luteolum]SDG36280.1 two-component system, cell cycle sensor histidine kinase PleC [Pelagibacterium luteolum]
MGSAEASGVSGKGFGSAKLQRTPPLAISASTVLIVLFTLTAGGCFIAYDVARSINDTRERAHLIATMAAAHIEAVGSEIQPDAISIPPALAEDFHLSLADAEGTIIFASLNAAEMDGDDVIGSSVSIADDDSRVSVFQDTATVTEAILLRAGMASGALILLAFAFYGLNRRSSARRLDGILPALEAVPYGLAHWREDGLLVCANSAFARHLKLSAQQLLPGTGYGDISRTIAGKITARPVLDAARQRMIEIEREDGSVILLDERPCPSGGFVTIVTDITDRKHADRLLGRIREEQKRLARRYHEEKLKAEASSRAKTSFLAHVSHDIRTPLNHIIGFADMLRLETFGPLGDRRYLTYLEDIKCSGEQLLKSFAEILEFAEIEGGRKALKQETLSVRELLKASAARVAKRAENAGIRLQVEVRGEGSLIGDRHYLDRMLGNLLDNAIRFTERDGLVRLGAWISHEGVVLEVTDTGAGMNEEQMSRLSQPFALSDASFARHHAGIGLGIATARAIAEQSGGRLAIDSLEGIGTTVAVSLPLVPADTSRSDHHAPSFSARAA